MIPFAEVPLSGELREQLLAFAARIEAFRKEGPLDRVAVAKLEEHFKASHIYHSAGIEGNRLTLQETVVVLKDGVDISGKPLKDSVEVRNLSAAFDCLVEMAQRHEPIRESDIRSLHSLIVRDLQYSPGEYRRTGVIISGAEHRPPEPLEVGPRMGSLVAWVNENINQDPIIVATVAHHELAAIHPFLDGNGRVARLLMNLVLLKRGYPIANIQREERPAYYDALSFADVGIYEPILDMVLRRSSQLFAEYERIRAETKRMADWADRWGTREAEVLMRREAREMELWSSRIRQIFLEFQKAAELLNDKLQEIAIEFHDYRNAIDFERYQKLLEDGRVEQSNAFSISFRQHRTGLEERFMFRYYRNFNKFPPRRHVIPLEANYFDREISKYTRLSEVPWGEKVRVREVYFNEQGEFVQRYFNRDTKQEAERKGATISEAVQQFFEDVLQNIFHLR
ncbi:MAG TPA: Fic family protein [Thermoanaerobaculia bacterium]|nr:Fic family protein [Thermoanaerobaculia bacterium]